MKVSINNDNRKSPKIRILKHLPIALLGIYSRGSISYLREIRIPIFTEAVHIPINGVKLDVYLLYFLINVMTFIQKVSKNLLLLFLLSSEQKEDPLIPCLNDYSPSFLQEL